MAAPFEIAPLPDGGRTATNGAATITLLDSDGLIFRRRAIKRAGTEQAQQVEWAVAELHGVRVYFDGVNVLVTTRDMQP